MICCVLLVSYAASYASWLWRPDGLKDHPLFGVARNLQFQQLCPAAQVAAQRVGFACLFFRGQGWQRHDLPIPLRQSPAMREDAQQDSACALSKLDTAE